MKTFIPDSITSTIIVTVSQLSTKRLAAVVCCAVLSLAFFASAAETSAGGKTHSRQNSSKQKSLWRLTDESRLTGRGDSQRLPEKYLIYRLDRTSLKGALAELPLENTDAAREKSVVMEIPLPDGSIQRFRVEETQVLAAHLAKDFPEWKTFVGYGVDDPTAIGRFDWNALGFHGYISTDQGTVMIDPYQKGDTANYMVFYKHDFGKSDAEFYCRTENQVKQFIEANPKLDFTPSAPAFNLGATVRTYRIAIATTGEWTRNAGGFPAVTDPVTLRSNALAVIMTAVNRLNGIYLRELATQFQLVNPSVSNNAANIVFDDPNTDPYDNTSENPQLTINHTTITNRVGTANFDIGHLFGTGGGGVAQSPSVCDNADKGQGYSARGTNTGDPFVVDYVAHEIGHQFGADHTYNNLDPNVNGNACTTRAAAEAFEVASGATIMSYVGICAARNLQQYNDFGLPSFHVTSLTKINANLTTGTPSTTGCGTTAGTNNLPTINAGPTFTIPRLTPFTLTATGGDADANDVANLLYSWEEYDLAPAASGVAGNPAGTFDVDTDGVPRPLLRAYSPVSNRSRTFPSLAFILNPQNNDAPGSNQPQLTYTGTHPTGFPGAVCETGATCVVGERLPTINRNMNFRVSIRDRRGGVSDAGTAVTVNAAAGPFLVTTQNTAPAVWQGGTTQTVTWDVAGTNANNINTANVNILLSTDGGQSFPITLAANTPNDGTEPITVPNNQTATARIKVEAVGNIFFDISNANFTINQNNTGSPTVAINNSSAGEGSGSFNASIVNAGGNPETTSMSFQVTLSAPASQTVTLHYETDSETATAGEDFIPVTGTLIFNPGETSKTIIVPILEDDSIEPDETFTVNLSAPINATIAVSTGIGTILNDDSCSFALSLTSLNIGSAGGTGSFSISTNPGCAWNARSNAGWITTTSSAIGNGTVSFTVSANNSLSPRTGTISVEGQIFTVNQSAATTVRRTAFDFDGDARADISVFRPGNGTWYLQQSTNGLAGTQFGLSTDKIVPADYDGDGKTDVAVFRSGTWYLQRSQLGFLGVIFGNADDIPVPADFDGDNRADIAVFRPSNGTWYVLNSSTNGFTATTFGAGTDKPVPADYDGDGKANIAVFRSSNGTWYTSLNPATNYGAIVFGATNDVPVPADYDADGKADVAVFRPSNGTWYLNRSQLGMTGVQFGAAGDLPTPADYDGDGKTDVAVFRSGIWYLNRSTSGLTGISFGTSTDKPTPNAYIR